MYMLSYITFEQKHKLKDYLKLVTFEEVKGDSH